MGYIQNFGKYIKGQEKTSNTVKLEEETLGAKPVEQELIPQYDLISNLEKQILALQNQLGQAKEKYKLAATNVDNKKRAEAATKAAAATPTV